MLRDRQTSEGLLEPEVCILPLGGELWNQEPGPGPSLEPWNQFKFGLEPEPGTGFNPVHMSTHVASLTVSLGISSLSTCAPAAIMHIPHVSYIYLSVATCHSGAFAMPSTSQVAERARG